eukprot:COSAG06_NODE_686_length_13075_cov_22.361381_2_plen_253_part_00
MPVMSLALAAEQTGQRLRCLVPIRSRVARLPPVFLAGAAVAVLISGGSLSTASVKSRRNELLQSVPVRLVKRRCDALVRLRERFARLSVLDRNVAPSIRYLQRHMVAYTASGSSSSSRSGSSSSSRSGSGAPRARVRLSARACVCGDLGLEIDSRATLPSRFSPSLIAPSSDHFCFLRQTVECMTNRPVWKTHPLGSFKPFPLLSVPSLAWQMIVLRRTRRKRLEKEANVRSVPGRQEHARHPPPKITLLTL